MLAQAGEVPATCARILTQISARTPENDCQQRCPASRTLTHAAAPNVRVTTLYLLRGKNPRPLYGDIAGTGCVVLLAQLRIELDSGTYVRGMAWHLRGGSFCSCVTRGEA